MQISELLLINIKKLKIKSKQSLFMIIPILILVGLSVVVTSQVENIQHALNSNVFSSIANQFKLMQIEVPKQDFNPSSLSQDKSSLEQNRFSQSDANTISAVPGVQSANLQVQIPISNVSTKDIATGKTVKLGSLYTLDSNSASLYTSSDFTYKEGETIPIILNSNSLSTTTENWNGKSTYTIEMPKPGDFGKIQTERDSFVKTEAIAYNKADLIGKEITVNFGGLDDIQNYTVSRTDAGTVFTKLTTAAYKAKIADRKTAISAYWNYSKISKPLTYKFKIVGIVEDDSNRYNYIPSNFADKLMKDYIAKEIGARTAVVPVSKLNTDFVGLTYNGDELTTAGLSGIAGQIGKRFEQRFEGAKAGITFGGRGGGGVVSMSFDTNFSGISIPGLVMRVDDSNKVTGLVSSDSIYTKANKYSDFVNVVLTDVGNRKAVSTAINKAGYSFQDNSTLAVFDNLQSTLNNISKYFLFGFIVFLGGVVLLSMGKFISESTREVGIFRAIGMRKSHITAMFITQTLLYTSIAYVGGLILGYGLNLLASGYVGNWFNKFVSDTISKTSILANSVDLGVFRAISWQSILIYSVVLLGLTLVVSIWPSITASRISPVEAIKSE